MNWKEEYINKFCTFEGENRMVFKNKITADESLNFIDQIISERDKEWQTWIERFKKLKGCPCMCDRCKNKLINGFK